MHSTASLTVGSMGSAKPVDSPKPPSLHWALVLLFWILTAGLFGIVWLLRQAVWVRRIDPTSKALLVLAVGFPSYLATVVLEKTVFSGAGDTTAFLALLARLAFSGALLWSAFSMRDSIEDRFGVTLSGPMTFFFHGVYLQYHLRRIARGEHTPESQGLR